MNFKYKQAKPELLPVISHAQMIVLGIFGFVWSMAFCDMHGIDSGGWLFSVLIVDILLSLSLVMLGGGVVRETRWIQYWVVGAVLFIFPYTGTFIIFNKTLGVFSYAYFLITTFYLLETSQTNKMVSCVLVTVLVAFYTHLLMGHGAQLLESELIAFYIGALSCLLFWAYTTSTRQKQTNQQIAKLQFLSGAIAHELRTPLSGVMLGVSTLNRYLPKIMEDACSETLCREKKEAQLTYYSRILSKTVNIMQENVKVGAHVIDMLLLKVKNERRDLNYEITCSAVRIIQDAMDEYPFALGEKEKISFNSEGDFVFKSNPEVMKHVIFNLMKNALYQIEKHKRGLISIWLGSKKYENVIHFKDTAIGIPEERVFRIFEESEDGTGLGLPFIKLAMENSKGSVECKSEYKKYIEFTLKFNKEKL